MELCIEAAGYEFDPYIQKLLLKVCAMPLLRFGLYEDCRCTTFLLLRFSLGLSASTHCWFP